MIGRIFMNQESKVINVYLEKRENKDYLVFGFEEVAEVCLNDDESQNNLKSIFVKLLTEITKNPVELQFFEKPEYKTGLYIDVCKEYIKDLNKEINKVVISYAMIKMLLLGRYTANENKLTEEDFIEVLYVFSRVIEHKPGFLNRLYNGIKEAGYDKIAYITILVH